MNFRFFFITAVGLACGCAQLPVTQPAQPAPKTTVEYATRDNAGSLLRELLDDEKNVSKVFIVKEGKQVEPLVKLIAATSASQEASLDALTNADRTLNLRASNLPPGERAARDAEAKTKERELLFSKGPHFEFNLLLTQAEALNYGWHLAKVAAENSSGSESDTFKDIGKTMRQLYEQTVSEMRTLPPR